MPKRGRGPTPRRPVRAGGAPPRRVRRDPPATTRRRLPLALWIGAAVLIISVAAVLIVSVSRRDEETAVARSTTPIAPPTRSPSVERRLAERDGASDTEPYTRVLDSLERKLIQSGVSLAQCVETGAADLARRGVQVSLLDLLTRIDELAPQQSTSQPVQERLTCRDIVRALSLQAPQP